VRRLFAGITGRVAFGVLAIAAVVFSLLGTVGYVQVASSGRRTVRERIDQVLDQLDANLRAGTGTVAITTADGVDARAVATGAAIAAGHGDQVVTRNVTINGRAVVLVGRASQARLTESLDSLWHGLWIAVPLATLASALMAAIATRRALRPVGAITDLAATIGDAAQMGRLPVPGSGDEIEQLALTLNEMLSRIERSRMVQRQFTSDAAHELRTPLMALQGELELAAHDPDRIDPATRDRLHHLTARLAARIDDLVLLATLDEGRPLAPTPIDVLDVLADEAASTGTEVAGAHATVVVDDALLRRGFANLVANARRHARAHVAATVEVVGDRVWVHVDDDGPGIAAGDRDRVFDRFTRLDESRAGGGAGLGLAIVASIAEVSGGGVAAADSPAGGARVSFWLPVTSSS
jgi:signal transduction histidine kinase